MARGRTAVLAAAAALSCVTAGPVSLTVNGAPAVVGEYTFPAQAKDVVVDNGLFKLTWGQTGSSILLHSGIINGTELVVGATGNSWYVDSGGGSASLVCDHIKILRVTPALVEFAWVDSHSNTLQHEHHMIVTDTMMGVYGYNIMTAAQATSISEVRFNSRWNRCLFDHSYNSERGHDTQMPTYAYLESAACTKIQDETWRVDGKSAANLACPTDNEGRLPAGKVSFFYCYYPTTVFSPR